MDTLELQTTVTVSEGDNIRLPCMAEGVPEPKYSWRRDDKQPIKIGQWSSMSIIVIIMQCFSLCADFLIHYSWLHAASYSLVAAHSDSEQIGGEAVS